VSVYPTTGTSADDTVILTRHDDPVTTSHKLQGHLDQLEAWLKKWRIKIDATKSVQDTFTLKKDQCPAVHINNTVIPQSPTATYLGLNLVSRLTVFSQKRKQIDLKVKDIYWIIGRKYPALPESKILLYKTIIKPIWTYGIQLWG
jgi:hypothetical protein